MTTITVKIIYRCNTHNSIERHTFQQTRISNRKTTFVDMTGREWLTRGTLPQVPCSQCDYNKIGDNARMIGKAIKGRVVENTPCADKCISATGPSCDCACGGENHGGNFDLNQRII